MAFIDFSQRIADLKEAAAICEQHQIQPALKYPRWPEAWKACEVVWRNYLDMQTIRSDQDFDDRNTVIDEARKLEGAKP